MKRVRSLFTPVFVVVAGLASAGLAHASSGGSGGSGARGGSGIVCGKGKSEVLEYYLAGADRAAVTDRLESIARKCSGARAVHECFYETLLAPLAATHARLAVEIRQVTREMGPAAGWKRTYSEFGVPQPSLLRPSSPLARLLFEIHRARFGRSFDAMTFPSSHSGGSYYFGPDTVFDDALEFDLPPDCTSVQLALVHEGSRFPVLTAEGEGIVADPVQARALELHEAIYAVAKNYGQASPLLTRALGVAVLTGHGVDVAADRFVDSEANRERFRARGPKWAEIADFGRVYPRSGNASLADPDYRVLEFDEVDGVLEHSVSVRPTGIEIHVRRLNADLSGF